MLERMLSNVNRGQGMGFMLLGTNITLPSPSKS